MTAAPTPIPVWIARRAPRWFLYPLLAGVIAPVLCLWGDPGILRADEYEGVAVGSLWLRASIVTAFAQAVVAILFGYAGVLRRRGAWPAPLLGASAVHAGLFQLVMVPFVLIGLLMFGLGLLGLCPLLVLHACLLLRQQVLATGARATPRTTKLLFALALVVPIAVGCCVHLRAPVALRAMWTAPTDALRRELRLYQVLFELFPTANELKRTIEREHVPAFEAMRRDLGILPAHPR